ncbi:AMZ2 protein, partial [Polypterus senegalus]
MQTIRHSEDALRTALISRRQDLMDRYNKYSPGERRLLEDCLRSDSTLFHPITLHSPSDWILAHPESTQDFEAFYKNPYRKTPNKGRNTVYILTIGSFGTSEDSTRLYVEWLQEYCEAFYYGLAVRLLEPVSVSETACAFRINENTCNLQIHAGSLLHYLKKRKPKDAFCIVGITMIDLYPEDSWNFVFGQASLTEGMGIFSFARYDDNFYSREYKGRIQKSKKLTPGDYSIFNSYYTPPVTSALLYRSCRVLFHPNSGAAGKFGDLQTVRLEKYKAFYITVLFISTFLLGGAQACRGDIGPEKLHNPPLIFDLSQDPAESAPLDQTTAEYWRVAERIAAKTKTMLRSIANDNTSQADYTIKASAAPCCNEHHVVCRCWG